MLKTTKCLNCGGALSLITDQTAIRCHYCDSEFFAENPSITPSATPSNSVSVEAEVSAKSSLKIEFGGVWVVGDLEIKIFLDGAQIGTGSIKKGFHVAVEVSAGKHVLELRMSPRQKRYDFEISADGNYRAEIEYSRAWGNFTSDLDLKRS